jgi:hypothetical protein
MSELDEDADVRAHLAALGPAALDELRRVLQAPDRTPVLRALTARPASALIAMADTDEVVRLRLLRAIRDLGPRKTDTTYQVRQSRFDVSELTKRGSNRE